MITLLLLLIFSGGLRILGVDFPRRYLELTLILQTHIHSPQIDISSLAIRTKLSPSHFPDPFLFPPVLPPKLINFISATLTEICKLICASESKQCPLDSIPTFLLKLCFYKLGPIITNLIKLVNLSFSEGIFPSSFKQALSSLFSKNIFIH